MNEPVILIAGAGGMLGRELAREVDRRCVPHVACAGRSDLDITNEAAVHEAIGAHRPRIVLNAAAYTDVDGSEDDVRAAQVNEIGPRHLARACRDHGTILVHFSTDYVFGGQGDSPYRIDAPTNPINAYGRTKLAGEQAIRASGAEHLIIRTSWLFAPHGKNFVLTMLRLADGREKLTVVDDQVGRPTACGDLAAMTLRLLDAGARGVYHAANDGSCSWFEFAVAIFELAHRPVTVEPCTSEAFPRPAKRPSYSVLDLSETTALIGPPRHWTEGLRDCIAELDRSIHRQE